MKSVVFFVRHQTSLIRMLPQYYALKEEGICEPVVMIVDERAFDLADKLRNDGVVVVLAKKVLRSDPVTLTDRRYDRLASFFPEPIARVLRKDLVAHSFPVGLWRAFRTVRAFKRSLKHWIVFLEENQVDVAMVPGDRELGAFPPLLKACNLLGISAVICTSNIPTRDSLAANRVGSKRFEADLLKIPLFWSILTRIFFPNQVAETLHGKMIFSPGWLVWSLAYLGMLSHRPWIQGAGNSDFVLLNSQERCEKYVAEGVEKKKVVQTGDLLFDALYTASKGRKKLRTEFGFAIEPTQPHERICLFAVPIFAEHKYLEWSVHLTTLRKCAQKLHDAGLNVILSLHPRSSKEDYLFLETDFGFRFDPRPLNEILPVADIFICGNSSTIEWAILLGQPTINLDYAGINDRAFIQYHGVLAAYTVDEFADRIVELQKDYTVLKQAQLDKADTISIFDGKSRQRFLAFVAEQLSRSLS